MSQLTEMRSPDEDWTGTTSRLKRRRLQNRLNQRARERRKVSRRTLAASSEEITSGVECDLPNFSDLPEQRDCSAKSPTANATTSGCTPGSGCLLLRPGAEVVLRRFANKAYEDYILGSPQPGYLSTLIQINVFNALTQNGFAVGFSDKWQRHRVISPFNSNGPDHPAVTSCPPNLQPTALQRAIRHHPWIDLFPIPQMRDNILAALNYLDMDELCGDLLDVHPGREDKPNLIVWGNPWDPCGWEASPAFLRKWGWMLCGCSEVLEATNHWRQKRGEKVFSFPVNG